MQNEFIKLRFNQLPKDDIINFLQNIVEKENLNMNRQSLMLIQKLYKSDIRSMINFMQSNQGVQSTTTTTPDSTKIFYIIEDDIWAKLYTKFASKETFDKLISIIQQISTAYNIDKKNIIKDFLNYIIRNKPATVSPPFLTFVENIMHTQDSKNTYYINYSISQLMHFISQTK